MAFSTSVVARELGAIGQTRAGAVDPNRSHVALTGTFAPAMNDMAMRLPFRLIEHAKLPGSPIGNEIPGGFAPHRCVGPAFDDSGASLNYSLWPHRLPADFERKPLEAPMIGICARAQYDSATAELMGRIRKVE